MPKIPNLLLASFATAMTVNANPAFVQMPAGGAPAMPDIVRGTIVAPAAKLELVFDGGCYLEGPVQGPDGNIYFSDITMTWRFGMGAGNIWVNDPKTGITRIFRSPSAMSNGLAFDAEGNLLAAHGADFGGRYITRTDMKTGKAVIMAGLYNGRPFNAPNDLTIDAKGRIYFTDPRYFGHEPVEQPVMGVYRIDTDRSVHLILADNARPNGIAVSPDQKYLYVTDNDILRSDRRLDPAALTRNGTMQLVRYDLSADGTPSNRKLLADFTGQGPGGIDGVKVDSKGNVYAAVQTKRRGVTVYDSEGKELAYVPTPEQPSNLALAKIGGRSWLYITVNKVLYRIETLIPPM